VLVVAFSIAALHQHHIRIIDDLAIDNHDLLEFRFFLAQRTVVPAQHSKLHSWQRIEVAVQLKEFQRELVGEGQVLTLQVLERMFHDADNYLFHTGYIHFESRVLQHRHSFIHSVLYWRWGSSLQIPKRACDA